jgi:O-antigen ligase
MLRVPAPSIRRERRALSRSLFPTAERKKKSGGAKLALLLFFDMAVALALCVTLLENRLPWLSAAGIVVVIIRGGLGRLSLNPRIKGVELLAVAAVAYWLLNYSWSTADLQNLYSFKFLRNDGALLVTYPAFLCMLSWTQKPSRVQTFWVFLNVILGLMAISGIWIMLGLPYARYFELLGVVGKEEELGGAQRLFYGWFQTHNTAGGMYAIGSICALGLLLEGGGKGGFKKALTWTLFLSCLGGLAITFSRSGYIAFAAGAMLLFPIRKFTKMVKVGLLVLVPTVLIALTSSSILNRIDTITDPNYGTNATRFDLWREALQDFSWSPIVGIGFGRYNDRMLQFDGVKYLVYVAKRGEIANDDSHAHNSYFHFMAEGGTIGVLLMLGIWWFTWRELAFYERHMADPKLSVLWKVSRASILALFTMSLTEHYLGRGSVVLTAMALTGMTIASSRAQWEAASRIRTKEGRKEKVSSGLSRKVLPGAC